VARPGADRVAETLGVMIGNLGSLVEASVELPARTSAEEAVAAASSGRLVLTGRGRLAWARA